jgi:hypothetical protein
MTCNRLALAFALALAFLSVILGAAEDLLLPLPLPLLLLLPFFLSSLAQPRTCFFLSVIPEGNLLQTALNLAKTPQNA